jgi:predicted N-acetyltransferase YhbS
MRIEYLADHEDAIPELAEWFYREWSYLYPGKTLRDVRKAIAERTNKESIPIALVALEGAAVIGTICLKTLDMDTRSDLSPWLAGLYVSQPWRGRHVGTALVSAIEEKATALGVRRLYLYTPDAERFYSRLAWHTREITEYRGTRVTVMEKELGS